VYSCRDIERRLIAVHLLDVAMSRLCRGGVVRPVREIDAHLSRVSLHVCSLLRGGTGRLTACSRLCD